MVRSVLMSMWAARCCSPPRPALPCPALPCPALGHSMHRGAYACGLWLMECVMHNMHHVLHMRAGRRRRQRSA
jgi:hypothetical protein